MKEKIINGRKFNFFGYQRKNLAKQVTQSLRRKGCYVRVLSSSRGYEIWYSKKK